jgi:hypothetical protein
VYGEDARSNAIADTSVEVASPPAQPLVARLQLLELVLIGGLAGVFLVNAVVAIVEPSDVRGLVERSLLGRLIPAMNGRWLAWAVAANDTAIGALLLATTLTRRARPLLLAWAGVWLLAVAVIKLTSLDAFGG